MPQWDPANPVSVTWGGSTFAVTSQSEQPELAAKVAMELYASEESLRDGVETNTIFPLNEEALEADWFIDSESSFFSGQKANQEVYIPAANAYEGYVYSPFTTAYYAELTKEIAAVNAGEKTGSEALDDLQETVEKYAKGQGFAVQ